VDELFDLLEDEGFFDIYQTTRLESYLYNLVQSGNLEEYYKLLTDFNFLVEKINHPEFGVQALIEDYDLIDDPPQPPLRWQGEFIVSRENWGRQKLAYTKIF
jgi:hypothetical protein